jgi:hypothetical protein
VLSDYVAPTIVPADIPGLIEAFSLRSIANSPFLYAYLASVTADSIAAEDRRLVSGIAVLSADLAPVSVPDIWASFNSDGANEPKSSVEDIRRRNRVSKDIEKLKLPAVKFAWFICEYKGSVSQDLENDRAPIFGNSRYKIEAKSGVRPSEFLSNNSTHRPGEEDCSDRVLRAIMASYNPLVARTGVFDFSKDVYDLKERENEVEKTIRELP